jgi:hypothetical protein
MRTLRRRRQDRKEPNHRIYRESHVHHFVSPLLLIWVAPSCDTLFQPMSQRIRVFATCDIGDASNILRQKGYDLEIYPKPRSSAEKPDYREGEVGRGWLDYHAARSDRR